MSNRAMGTHIEHPNHRMLGLAALLFFLVLPRNSIANESPDHRVHSTVQELYVPALFSEGENVKIFVRHRYPSVCHGSSSAEIHRKGSEIHLAITEEVMGVDDCPRWPRSNLLTVNLGAFDLGQYDLFVNGRKHLEGFEVKSRTAMRYMFPPVDTVVQRGRQIVLRGHFRDRCSRLKSLVWQAQKSRKVITVELSMSPLSNCVSHHEVIGWEEVIDLEDPEIEGSYLLLVKNAYGADIHRILNVTAAKISQKDNLTKKEVSGKNDLSAEDSPANLTP